MKNILFSIEWIVIIGSVFAMIWGVDNSGKVLASTLLWCLIRSEILKIKG